METGNGKFRVLGNKMEAVESLTLYLPRKSMEQGSRAIWPRTTVTLTIGTSNVGDIPLLPQTVHRPQHEPRSLFIIVIIIVVVVVVVVVVVIVVVVVNILWSYVARRNSQRKHRTPKSRPYLKVYKSCTWWRIGRRSIYQNVQLFIRSKTVFFG